MESSFILFRSFIDEILATEVIDLFAKNEIDFQVADNKNFLEPVFSNNNPLFRAIKIFVNPTNVERATTILEEYYLSKVENIDADYYLYECTEEELLQIVSAQEEWNELDVLIAKKLLKDKGYNSIDTYMQNSKENRIHVLSQKEESSLLFLIFGYIFSLLGGFIGVFIGMYLSFDKKTLPNGERMYSFAKQERNHGTAIIIIGIVSFIVWNFLFKFIL